MNYSLKSFLKLFAGITVMLLLTACPGPGTIKKAIRRSEFLQLNNRFERLFRQSVNTKETALVFSYVDKSPGYVVYFGFNPGKSHSNWELDVFAFQKKLKETNTVYQSIEINNGSDFFYTAKNLENYDRALRLFKENLKQIREGRIDDLYRTMGETGLEFESIKELIAYVKVKNFKDFELISYPPESILSYNSIAFCLHANANDKLYFSYVSEGDRVFLKRIDLDNFSKV